MKEQTNNKHPILFLGGFGKLGGVGIWNTMISKSLNNEIFVPCSFHCAGKPPDQVLNLDDIIRNKKTYFKKIRFIGCLTMLLVINIKNILNLYNKKTVYLKDIITIVILLREARLIKKYFKDKYEKYYVYVSHSNIDEGLLGVFIKKIIANVVLVIHEHGGGIEFSAHHPNIIKYLNKEADIFVVASKYMKGLIEKKGVNNQKIEILPCAIRMKLNNSKPKKEDIILFCGAMEHRKDPITLLKSVPLVAEKFPNIQFIFIGDGSLLDYCKEYTEKCKLSSNVQIMGSLANNLAMEYFRRAKMFVLPSIREPFGIVLLEALYSYTPCIVTNTGGMPEIISNTAGIVVPQKDHRRISKEIIDLLSDSNRWERYSEEGYEKVKKIYDVNIIVRKFESIILNAKNKCV